MTNDKPILVSHQVSPSVHVFSWLLIFHLLFWGYVFLTLPRDAPGLEKWEALIMPLVVALPVTWYVYSMLARTWVRLEGDTLEVMTRFSRRRYGPDDIVSIGADSKYVFWGFLMRTEMCRESLYLHLKDQRTGRLRPLRFIFYHLSDGTLRVLGRFDVNFNRGEDRRGDFFELYKKVYLRLMDEFDRRMSSGETVSESDDPASSRWEVDSRSLRVRQPDGLFKEYPLAQIEPCCPCDSRCRLFYRTEENGELRYEMVYSDSWNRPRASLLAGWLNRAWRPEEPSFSRGPYYRTLFPLPFVTVSIFCVFSFFSVLLLILDDGTSDFKLAAVMLAVPAVGAVLWFLFRSLTFYRIYRGCLEVVSLFPRKTVRPLFYEEIESEEYLTHDFAIYFLRTFTSARFSIYPDEILARDRFRGPIRIRYFGFGCYANKFEMLKYLISQKRKQATGGPGN